MNNAKKISWSRLAVVGLILIGCLIVTRCDFQKVTDPESVGLFKSSYYGMSLHDSNGMSKTEFYSFETLFLKAEALTGRPQCDIQVIRLSDKKIIRRAIVLSDHEKKINSIPLWYDIGTDEQGHEIDVAGEYVVHFLRFKPLLNVIIPFTVKNGPDPAVPHVRGVRQDGTFNGGSVLVGEAVYAKGSGFPPFTEVRLYIIADKREHFEGDPLIDESGGYETVTTAVDGSIPNTLIWSSASAVAGAGFDIVADVAPFGKYNKKDGIAEALLTGFVVQEPAAAADIVTQLACDASGTYKDVFDSTEAISVWTNPPRRPLHPDHQAAVYIVSHQDVWTNGDVLVSMPFETTHEMPFYKMDRFLCGNLYPFNIVPRKTPPLIPNLVPGKYDVIIDMGRDGVYHQGTDILDGGSQVGFTVPGTPPVVLLTVSMNSDFLLPGETGLINVKLIRGTDGSPIIDAPVTLEIIYGPGSLTITNTTTNSKGIAQSEFSGGTMGEVTGVEVTAHVDGEDYTETISTWVKIPYPHDQGGIGGR